MSRPTEQDIRKTKTGYYVLPCDGSHELPTGNHLYLYYTKKEVIRLWRQEHPKGKKVWSRDYLEGKK